MSSAIYSGQTAIASENQFGLVDGPTVRYLSGAVGGGTKNYVRNPNFETDVGSVPNYVTITNITAALTEVAGEVLFGVRSLKITSNGGAQGSVVFALDAFDSFVIGKPIYFSAKSRSLTGYTANDMYWVVLEDGVEIASTKIDIPLGDYEAKGFFVPSSGKVYTVAVKEKSSPAASGSISVDSVTIGEQENQFTNVITDWQDRGAIPITAATTNPTKGTVGTDKYFTRRVGDSLEIYANYTQSTAGTAGSGLYQFTLPDGLQADASKVASIGSGGAAQLIGDVAVSDGPVLATRYNATLTSSTVISFNIWNSGSSATFGTAALRFSFFTRVPIVGWSSNIQVADRALEEFVSHNGSAVVYGISGAVIPTSTPAGIFEQYTLPFSNVNSTDSFILEVREGASGSFIQVPSSSIETLRFDGTNYIGAGVYNSGSSIVLIRGKYRQGTTVPWSTLSANTSWRVRKVSGGGLVGFPINARNILGDTSGTAVPAGRIGEVIRNQVAPTTASASLTTGNLMAIVLTAGSWRVTAFGHRSPATTNSLISFNLGISETSAAFEGDPGIGFASILGNTTTRISNITLASPTRFFNVPFGTTKTIYLVYSHEYAGTAGTIAGVLIGERIA